MKSLTVNLGPDTYNIDIENGSFARFGQIISEMYPNSKIAIITDTNVEGLYGHTLKAQFDDLDVQSKLITFPAGEASKHLRTMPAIYAELSDFNFNRRDLIVALGGGVVGDLAGFVAGTYLRGVDFIQIPTTLLSQVDSSVGGKVGVDTDQGKNLVGNFKQPKRVLMDPEMLNTLTDHYFRDGMAEVIKYGCIFSRDFFDFLKPLTSRQALMDNIVEILYQSCNFKRLVVEMDEKDTGERMLLNYGHTIGHALEAHTNYQEFSHGYAIAIGMVKITELAEAKGLTLAGTAEEVGAMFRAIGLPTHQDKYSMEELISYMKQDKKNLGSQLNVILLEEVGKSFIYPTTVDFFLGEN